MRCSYVILLINSFCTKFSVLGKMSPGKIPPEKCPQKISHQENCPLESFLPEHWPRKMPLENFPPGKLPSGKFPPGTLAQKIAPMKLVSEFFLISSFFLSGFSSIRKICFQSINFFIINLFILYV